MSSLRIVKGGVCSAKGFRAAGVAAEIKYKGRNDVALIVADEPCAAAAVFTTNKVAAAPVLYDRTVVRGGVVQAMAIVAFATAFFFTFRGDRIEER